MSKELTGLSRIISHALRHEPHSYGIKLDSEGWISLSELISALNSRGYNVDEDMVVEMISKSEKKRHQIENGKIRAYYGHSVKEKIVKKPEIPPENLYHGTAINSLESIMEKGLLPMNRQYVHLSINEDMAIKVGLRKSENVVVLKIIAKEAYEMGVLFFKEENGVWLSEAIPSNYIESNR